MDFKKLYELPLLAEASYVKFDESEGTLFDALQSSSIGEKMSATQADDFVSTWEIVSYQKNTDNGFSATLFRKKDTEEYVYACRGTEASLFSTDLWNADIGDIVTDGLAIKQIVDMYNHRTWLNTSYGEAYQAADLEHLDLETDNLISIKLAGTPQDYENYVASLYAQGNIIIDEPGGDVYRISLVSSTTVYPPEDGHALGAGVLNGGETISATGHSLGGHLATAFTRLFSGVEAVTINGAGYPTGTTPGLRV